MPAEQGARLPAPRANRYRDTWCGQVSPPRVGDEVRVAGWVHRRRDHGGLVFVDLRDRTGLRAGRVQPRDRARGARALARAALGVGDLGARRGRAAIGGDGQPRHGDGRGRGPRRRLRGARRAPRRRRSRSTRTRRWTRRCACATATSTCAASRCSASLELRHDVTRAIRDFLDERRLPRPRDADPDALDPRGRARLRRAEPPAARQLLRAAAVAAALQAAADDRRLRALLPDRALLPRRGAARGPPARVHAARHGDGVRRGGGRDGASPRA